MSINTEEKGAAKMNEKLNTEKILEAQCIGDSIVKSPTSPSKSLESFFDTKDATSHSSCESFKAICHAWANRGKNASKMSIQTNRQPLEEKIEELVSKLNSTENEDDSRELAKTLSVCVMMESHTLKFSESSEDCVVASASEMLSKQYILEPEEIRVAYSIFKSCDKNFDGMIDMNEVKFALEKLSVPQTHLTIKGIIARVVDKPVTELNFCQFLLCYMAILQNRVADTNITDLPGSQKALEECVNVSEVGVNGAKQFFEAKIARNHSNKGSQN